MSIKLAVNNICLVFSERLCVPLLDVRLYHLPHQQPQPQTPLPTPGYHRHAFPQIFYSMLRRFHFFFIVHVCCTCNLSIRQIISQTCLCHKVPFETRVIYCIVQCIIFFYVPGSFGTRRSFPNTPLLPHLHSINVEDSPTLLETFAQGFYTLVGLSHPWSDR